MTNRSPLSMGKVLAACLTLSITPPLEAQGLARLGVRAGVGIDRTGQAVYVGQIDLTEVGTTHSVELALMAFGARLDQAYTGASGDIQHAYEELTHVEGLGLIGSVLLGHARRGRWPYVVAGLGVGPLQVQWRVVSPTDRRLGTSRPSGGSFREESVVKLGSVLRLGVGLRLHERLDVRVQAHALVVPSTAARDDMKIMPTMTFSTGVGL